MPSQSAHRQKFVGCKTTTVSSGYVGEIKENLREGYGVYTYPNSFYRYEGEWKEGIKDGYGRLKMRDGSYYEGLFTGGEITGHGYRYWADKGVEYEGEFVQGELNGCGTMKFSDGSSYEGKWLENKREGEGVLITPVDGIYRGSFHLHKRHGDGIQTYTDGNEYKGSWVNNQKQGHGVMTFTDGSTYEGQWRADKMNGEGRLVHSSEISYEGLWVNGRPALEPSKLRVVGEEVIEIEQDSVFFDLEVECLTAADEHTPECGRLLQISAGLKLEPVTVKSSKGSVHSHLSQLAAASSNVHVERLSTPFGFDVEAYPVCIRVPSDDKNVMGKCGDESEPSTNATNSPDLQSPTQFLPDCESPSATPRNEEEEEMMDQSSKKETQRTMHGHVKFLNVTLPSLLPAHAKTSMSNSNDSVDGRAGSKNRKQIENSTTKVDKRRGEMERSEQRERSGSTKKRKIKIKQQHEIVTEASNEIFCKPGDYVIIIEDVTPSPFLDIKLEPAYLHVKVTK